jgi:hypothetical protein
VAIPLGSLLKNKAIFKEIASNMPQRFAAKHKGAMT